MQFVNEEWAKTWQQEYRSFLENFTTRSAAYTFFVFLFSLWVLRYGTPHARQMCAGAIWYLAHNSDRRRRHLPFSPQLTARLRAVACQALLLMGYALALELAFFAIAFCAGSRLTVPLQALVAHDPDLAWPAIADRSATVLAPAALGHAFGVVPLTCIGLSVRLFSGHKPKPSWVGAIARFAMAVPFVGFIFVAEATCVATYRSPLAAVAVGLLVIAAYALLVALLGRQWEAHASAEAAEPAEA